VRVRVDVEQDYALRPVRNVIARLPGRTTQEVVIGNHFDAWILGGVDPHTGTAATLQVARGLAALKAGGWQPRRAITLGFWDAEEYGVVGSTEWVEDHAAELAANAVAYFNVDMFTAGVLDVSGSPALRDLVVSAADDVRDPLTGRALSELWRERQARAAAVAGSPRPLKPDLADIGAGSDWTAFLYFVGVPSLQWTMNGRGSYGVYHSVLDDFEYYRRFADSAFVHTPALAQVMGLAALRLAEADALPFRYAHYAERIFGHIRAVEDAHGVRLDDERAAVERLLAGARSFEGAQAAALEQGRAAQLARADAELQRVEQAFLDPEGLPGRPWYRHRIYAPGADTGYDPLPLAPLVEALRAGDGAALDRARRRLTEALERANRVLASALERLGSMQ
jgi:N-acetylated-alpha-linked acidic dipeptidase